MLILAAQPWMSALSAAEFRIASIMIQAAVDGVFTPTGDLWKSCGINPSGAGRSMIGLAALGLVAKMGRGRWKLADHVLCAAHISETPNVRSAHLAQPKTAPHSQETDFCAQRTFRANLCGYVLEEDSLIDTDSDTESGTNTTNLVDQRPERSKRSQRTRQGHADSGPPVLGLDVAPAPPPSPAGPADGQLDLFQVDRIRPVEPPPIPIKEPAQAKQAKPKRETSADRRRRVEAAPIDPNLVDWCEWWNDLAKRRIVRHEVKVPPRLEVRLAWDTAMAVDDLRDILQIDNRVKLEKRLTEAGAYDAGWWTFAKFLGAKMGDRMVWKLTALFDGGYAFESRKQRGATNVAIVGTGSSTVGRRLAAAGLR